MSAITNYEIILEKYFSESHQRTKRSRPTHFRDSFLLALNCPDCPNTLNLDKTADSQCENCPRVGLHPKLHLVKSNFPIWSKWISEVNAGKATLSIKQWVGSPQKSIRETLIKFDSTSNIGVQKIRYRYGWEVDCPNRYDSHELAANNGMSLEDWQAIFCNADRSKPMAIIHFTDFRY